MSNPKSPQQPASFSPNRLLTLVKAFLPPFLWAAMIFYLSSQSVLQTLDGASFDFFFKKIAHMSVYAILYFLLYRALVKTMHFQNPSLYWLIPLMLCLIYAASDEFHQSLVPGRSATGRDIGYDMLGAMIALLRQYGYI